MLCLRKLLKLLQRVVNHYSTNPLMANVPISANQLTGFYMMGTLAVKGLKSNKHDLQKQSREVVL